MASNQEIGKLVIRLIAEVKELKTGLAQAQKTITDFGKQVQQSGKASESAFGGIKESYLKMVAAVYGGYKTLQKTMQWVELGSRAQAIESAFNSITASIGVNGKALIEEMQKVSKVWIDTTDVMVKAQRLLVEGMKPDEIVNLVRASTVAAKLMGKTVSESFDLISESLITLRTRGLKQAFPMEQEEVLNRYASSLGTISKYLSEAGQRQAIYNEIVRQTNEKMGLLGNTVAPTNYEKVQLFNSALDRTKEILAIELTNSVFSVIEVLGYLIKKFQEFTSPELRAGIRWFVEEMNKLSPAGKFREGLKQLDLLANKLKPKEITPETRYTKLYQAQLEAQLDSQKKIDDETKKSREKDKIERKKLEDDLNKFRLANEEQRIASQASIERMALQKRKTEEITALKLQGKDTEMVELEWNRKIAQAEYEQTMKLLNVKRRAEIEAAKQTGMDVVDVRKKYDVLEEEAAEKLALELGEIEAKKALSYESLYGMTETELQKRLEYSRALREGDLDDAIRANRVQEALEAKLSQKIIKNRMAEDQFMMTKEDRLRSEIEINKELLGYAEQRLSNLSEEDEEWVSAYNAVEEYKNKITELNHELDRETASFEKLIESGLKKYAVSLKENLIYSMETFVPRSIDSAGNAFKTFLKDVSSGTKSISESFKDLARNFGESIMDMIIDIGLLIAKMELLKALNIDAGGKSTGGGGKASTGGWLMSILNLIGGLFQSGGQIKGPSGIDQVPIRATAGEYIQPLPAVKYYGLDVMERLRARQIPREALLSLISGKPSPTRINPSFAMQAGGVVPSIEGGAEDKKTEITLINVVDQREMDAWAASARGQNAIINVISSRSETVRKILQ